MKVGFFSRWVFGIFLKKVFLQGGFLAFFKKRFFCKVFFFKKLNDVLKGDGFFSMGGGRLLDLVVNFIVFFYSPLRLTRNPYLGQIHMNPPMGGKVPPG